MICKTCGRTIKNEEANFCEYCGSSFRERDNISFPSVQQEQMKAEAQGQAGAMPSVTFPGMMDEAAVERRTLDRSQLEKPMTFLEWLGNYGIIVGFLFIPFGWIGSLVMLCIWAFGDKTTLTKKNWARVNLIVFAVIFLVFIMMLVSIAGSPMFQDMMINFNKNGYFENLYGNMN